MVQKRKTCPLALFPASCLSANLWNSKRQSLKQNWLVLLYLSFFRILFVFLFMMIQRAWFSFAVLVWISRKKQDQAKKKNLSTYEYIVLYVLFLSISAQRICEKRESKKDSYTKRSVIEVISYYQLLMYYQAYVITAILLLLNNIIITMIIINIIIDYIVLFYYHSNSYRDNDTASKANVIELICDDKSKLMRN